MGDFAYKKSRIRRAKAKSLQRSTTIDAPIPVPHTNLGSLSNNIQPDQVLQLQRIIGNTATQRLIQRSHGQACGCPACSGGASDDQQAETPIQRQTAESDSHGAGCRCAGCSPIQRAPYLQQSVRSAIKIQRLMAVDAFKKQTKAMGFRNLIKPIDQALATYTTNSSKMSAEQKVTALQNIVGLCDVYLNNAKRKKSNRRGGVEALKNEAVSEISQLQVKTPEITPSVTPPVEETQSVDTTPEATQSVETTSTPPVEETQSVETTPETTQSVETTSTPPVEETQSVDTTPEVTQSVETTSTPPVEETQSVDTTPETTQSVETTSTPPVEETPVDPEKTAATDYLNRLVKGEDIFASGPLKEGETAKTRKEILDLLQTHLSAAEFTQAASLIILNVPQSVVEGDKARKVALSHLAVLFKDKSIARTLLDKNTAIVVVPKNKKMTDLPQFSSLVGKKTFDGRDWDKVRGSGGMEINGHIYVAVTEENVLGTDAEGDVSGTQWCYASGYSTTTHEIAHVIDMHGLSDEDRKKVDELYKAKKDKQAKGEVVEWIDGFDYDQPGTKKEDAQKVVDDWTVEMPGKLAADGMTDVQTKNSIIAWLKYILVDGGAYADNTYTAWLKHLKVIDGNQIKKKDGTVCCSLNTTSKKAVFGGKQTNYASSHRLEYFAQTANAFFGTNTGNDPYTGDLWTAFGEADKGTRRNGKSEVTRIEPELKAIFDRIFGAQDIDDANPRNKVKQDKESTGGTGG